MKRVALGILTAFLLLGIVCASIAQEARVFHGRVIRVQGTTMAFSPDSGGVIHVEASQVDRESHEFLQSGDAMTIEGEVTADGNRVIADSIMADR